MPDATMPIHASRRVGDHAVEAVHARVLRGDLVADLVDLALEVERERREQAALGERLAWSGPHVGQHGRCTRSGSRLDRRGAVGDVGDDLERRPQSARPRHRDRVPAEVEHLGRIARVEQRHVQVLEHARRRRRQRRALGARVVARERDRAAVLDVPAYTAWRIASVARSTPGALPYQMPSTPS